MFRFKPPALLVVIYVLLRKEEGRWKILMDADEKEGTDESVFEKARPMD